MSAVCSRAAFKYFWVFNRLNEVIFTKFYLFQQIHARFLVLLLFRTHDTRMCQCALSRKQHCFFHLSNDNVFCGIARWRISNDSYSLNVFECFEPKKLLFLIYFDFSYKLINIVCLFLIIQVASLFCGLYQHMN